MRQFIVKQFALDCWVKIGRRTFNFTRASRIIYPLFILAGLATIDGSVLLRVLTYVPLAVSVYFGFVYFRFYPVKFHELNEVQKYQYSLKKPLTKHEQNHMLDVIYRLNKKYNL